MFSCNSDFTLWDLSKLWRFDIGVAVHGNGLEWQYNVTAGYIALQNVKQIYEEAAAHARVSMLSLAGGAWPASPTLYRDLDTNR